MPELETTDDETQLRPQPQSEDESDDDDIDITPIVITPARLIDTRLIVQPTKRRTNLIGEPSTYTRTKEYGFYLTKDVILIATEKSGQRIQKRNSESMDLSSNG